jgi:MerR family transcriptional regulator, light-induced transcriptional regulator
MYRIKRVAHLTGINPATLRAWERRYNLISPRRTDSGYRLYSDEDVAMLMRLKQLIDEGLTISEAIARAGRGHPPLPPDAPAPALLELRVELRDALLRFDRPAALAAYDRAAHLRPEHRVEQLLLPTMRELGDLWEHGDAVVSQEHFASAFVREKLSQTIAALDTGIASGPEGVCAGLPGELHEFGLMAAAVRLAGKGWRVLYLGADVPLDDVRRIVRERRPQMLCTSAVMRLDADEFRALAAELRGMAPRDTAVVIGGAGIPPLEGRPVPGVRLAACTSEIFSVN